MSSHDGSSTDSSTSTNESQSQSGNTSSNTGYGNSNTFHDSAGDADDEQSSSSSSSDNNEILSNDDSQCYSTYNSPKPDEATGEIIQCAECHCCLREGQSHTCEPEEKDKCAKA
ncbi:uncharacterized protein F4812DRAFT_447843 [Daldinia caldariorum]|uniref:uncharacterized protein n=1 Tax=Daldinia caldariorum TaxID=326644 RepID=UPI002007B113|nr:uncharacterized protein F4812DRAFT_447843 [Daldinia caldariorum]KAI1463170.1 hypothetical protein F4812DRAFT_447843 [Daldinia caldariorum]